MDRRLIWVALGVLALLWVLRTRGQMPTLSLSERAVGQSWSPYAYWLHESPYAYVHHFPAVVGANCLPLVFQTEDVGQALDHVEVSRAGCAQ